MGYDNQQEDNDNQYQYDYSVDIGTQKDQRRWYATQQRPSIIIAVLYVVVILALTILYVTT